MWPLNLDMPLNIRLCTSLTLFDIQMSRLNLAAIGGGDRCNAQPGLFNEKILGHIEQAIKHWMTGAG